MEKPIEQNIAGFAYAEIKRMILLKELKPGQRLAEIALSQQIGVSRTPVREALRKLANEGWVCMIQNSGVWVSSPTRREVLDAYEVRNRLELWGIEKAIPNISPLLIHKLEENVEEEARIYREKRSVAYPDINNNFHMLIAEAGGNDALCRHLQMALSMTQVYMVLYEDYFDFNTNLSLMEHRGILEAIKARDGQSVMERMKFHINQGFEVLRLS